MINSFLVLERIIERLTLMNTTLCLHFEVITVSMPL